MPTKEEVYCTADQLRASGARVSIRSVQKSLSAGGSYRVIGEHLASWKAERSYYPRLEVAQLPPTVEQQLAKLGNALWEHAMQAATCQFDRDRERTDALLLNEQQLRDEALLTTDAAEARIAAAEERADRLTGELAVAREQIKGLTRKLKNVRASSANAPDIKRLERKSANEFWNRVMAEVHSLMDALTRVSEAKDEFLPAALVVALPQDLHHEALRRGEILDAATLAARMTTRAKHNKFFVHEPASGSFKIIAGYRNAAG